MVAKMPSETAYEHEAIWPAEQIRAAEVFLKVGTP